MYVTAEVKEKDLEKVIINKQEEIVDTIGYALDPKKAKEIIARETKNFTIETEKGKEADTRFGELLAKNGIQLKAPKEKDIIKIKEKERKRALSLLSLELELKNKKK